MKKVPVFLLIIPLLLSACTAPSPKKTEKTDFAMDTVVTITLFGDTDSGLLEDAFALIADHEARFSKTLPQSEVSLLNAAGGGTLSAPLAAVLAAAQQCSAQSGGAFSAAIGRLTALWDFHSEDAAVPSPAAVAAALPSAHYENVVLSGDRLTLQKGAQLDLGGIAKGYIADEVKAFLQRQGVTSGIINLGGDVMLIGDKGGAPFVVGVDNPQKPGTLLCTVAARDCALVTSGTYRRAFTRDGTLYHHILDPKTGLPAAAGLSAVTIAAPSALLGDALSTACLVLGAQKGAALLADYPDVQWLFVDERGEILPESTLAYQ